MLPGPEGTLRAARPYYNQKWAGRGVTDDGCWFAYLAAVRDALG